MSENIPDKPKWYFKSWSLIGSFLCVGPLMLPLVWFNPNFSKNKKIIITIIVLVITYFLTSILMSSLKSISSYYQLLDTF